MIKASVMNYLRFLVSKTRAFIYKLPVFLYNCTLLKPEIIECLFSFSNKIGGFRRPNSLIDISSLSLFVSSDILKLKSPISISLIKFFLMYTFPYI
jgi:hypothetical protein